MRAGWPNRHADGGYAVSLPSTAAQRHAASDLVAGGGEGGRLFAALIRRYQLKSSSTGIW